MSRWEVGGPGLVGASGPGTLTSVASSCSPTMTPSPQLRTAASRLQKGTLPAARPVDLSKWQGAC